MRCITTGARREVLNVVALRRPGYRPEPSGHNGATPAEIPVAPAMPSRGHDAIGALFGGGSVTAEDEFAADLVFSDVIMPGMNGVELACVIRARYPGLPVVLTSGYSNVLAENAHRGFDLIQKPYSVESLSRILRKAISEKASAH